MKNNKVYVFMIILFFYVFMPKLTATAELAFPDPNLTISMDLQDASLKDILKIFSMQSGLNFIASQAVQDRRITLYLDKVTVDTAMDKLFKANNLSYELDKNANIIIVKDWGIPQVETVTKVFYLKYATVSSSSLKEEMHSTMGVGSSSVGESTTSSSSSSSTSSGSGSSGKWNSESEAGITQAIKKLLTSNGSLIEDYRTNSLIVTDIPSRMNVITQTIAALDVSIPQIMLEVEMLDVSKNSVDKLGVLYSQTPLKVGINGATASWGFPFKNWGDVFSAENFGSIGINTLTGAAANTYTAALDFLTTQTDTKYLARPRILTLNNETAEIKIVTQESIGVTSTTEASTATTSASVERAETGVLLRVTPQINMETGEITMFLNPQVSEATRGNALTSGSLTYQFRDPEVRTTKSAVRIKDGETVIIGGLIRNIKNETDTKLPFLSDIPFLGAMFRHKDKSKDEQRELLVFITPHIIKENNNVQLAQANRVNIPLREQNTASGIDRQVTISTALNGFDKKR